jgi:hypothetical protein
MSSLYEITEDAQALDNLIESCLVDEDGNPREPSDEESKIILEMIGETEGAFRSKAENICKFRANLKADIEDAKKEEERIAKRRKTKERKIEALRIYMEIAMDRIKSKKLEVGTFRLQMQKNPPAVSVLHEELVDAKYFKIIPETREVSKAELKKDFPVGAYPWGIVSQIESLRIE